jgi:hypothetical protein
LFDSLIVSLSSKEIEVIVIVGNFVLDWFCEKNAMYYSKIQTQKAASALLCCADSKL